MQPVLLACKEQIQYYFICEGYAGIFGVTSNWFDALTCEREETKMLPEVIAWYSGTGCRPYCTRVKNAARAANSVCNCMPQTSM